MGAMVKRLFCLGLVLVFVVLGLSGCKKEDDSARLIGDWAVYNSAYEDSSQYMFLRFDDKGYVYGGAMPAGEVQSTQFYQFLGDNKMALYSEQGSNVNKQVWRFKFDTIPAEKEGDVDIDVVTLSLIGYEDENTLTLVNLYVYQAMLEQGAQLVLDDGTAATAAPAE